MAPRGAPSVAATPRQSRNPRNIGGLTRAAPATNHDAVILTELPDLPPRPPTPRNAVFRREFYQRWGRENCVVSGISRRAEYRLFRQTLSLKCVARGTETYFVDRRRVTVSDETFLVLNEGREYASKLDSPTDAYSFSLFFRPGLAQEVAGDLSRSLGEALDNGAENLAATIEFDEALRAHDSNITPVLRFIQRQIVAGVRDEHWLEEQCQFLLGRLIEVQRRQRSSVPTELAAARPAKRAELAKRLQWASDFMHAHLGDEISLADIAAAASLSRFHFLRLFQIVHGCTPVAYLRELRTQRALALLESTNLRSVEVAKRVGMSRVAMWRSLRRFDNIPRVGFLGR
jgi:AraC-like DNA-binding protein